MNKTPPTIAYLFTTFPKPTETFLQREVIAMIEREAPTLEVTVRSGAVEAVARLKQAIAKGS